VTDPVDRRLLTVAMLVVGVAVAAWGALGVPARATDGARTTADEPQYLLTAISLGEDRSLDISDELQAERWRPFHENLLPVQTAPRADGRELSPHDPLLPVLLAVPVAVGGASGAKAFLALLGGVLAGLLVWTAVRRLGCRPVPAGIVVAAFGLSPPLAAYATQVYPELPAALATAVAVAALTGPLRRAGVAVMLAAVVALPWLGVKYAPVAVALALCLVWRLAAPAGRRPAEATEDDASAAVASARSVAAAGPGSARRRRARADDDASASAAVTADAAATPTAPTASAARPRRRRIPLDQGDVGLRTVIGRLVVPVGVLVVAGVAFLALHRLWYGGWTVYAAGDHFVGGELEVVGTEVSYLGRSRRLVGLLVDRDFGLAAWGPVALAAVGALAALARRRPSGWGVLVLPLLAGWLNATFVALTMHGFWWPGRQVVVVVPCMVLATAWWADRLGARALAVVAALGLAGMALWATVLWQEAFSGWALVIDVDRWANPVVGAWRRTLPDNRDGGATASALQTAWMVVGLLGATWAWSTAPPDRPPRPLPDATRTGR